MGTIFSETLTRMRKEAGFPTAYRFYHDNGGAPQLKLTYRNYMLIEQGKNLPMIDKLERIILALRLAQATPAANKLVIAWLKTLAGEDTYKNILEPVVSAKTEAGSLSPANKTLDMALAQKRVFLSLAQYCATLTSFEA